MVVKYELGKLWKGVIAASSKISYVSVEGPSNTTRKSNCRAQERQQNSEILNRKQTCSCQTVTISSTTLVLFPSRHFYSENISSLLLKPLSTNLIKRSALSSTPYTYVSFAAGIVMVCFSNILTSRNTF